MDFPKPLKNSSLIMQSLSMILKPVSSNRKQLELLQKFVAERGGGFLMLGGQESLAQGKYTRTPVADLLPVYLDRLSPVPPGAKYQLNLTREGPGCNPGHGSNEPKMKNVSVCKRCPLFTR